MRLQFGDEGKFKCAQKLLEDLEAFLRPIESSTDILLDGLGSAQGRFEVTPFPSTSMQAPASAEELMSFSEAERAIVMQQALDQRYIAVLVLLLEHSPETIQSCWPWIEDLTSEDSCSPHQIASLLLESHHLQWMPLSVEQKAGQKVKQSPKQSPALYSPGTVGLEDSLEAFRLGDLHESNSSSNKPGTPASPWPDPKIHLSGCVHGLWHRRAELLDYFGRESLGERNHNAPFYSERSGYTHSSISSSGTVASAGEASQEASESSWQFPSSTAVNAPDNGGSLSVKQLVDRLENFETRESIVMNIVGIAGVHPDSVSNEDVNPGYLVFHQGLAQVMYGQYAQVSVWYLQLKRH